MGARARDNRPSKPRSRVSEDPLRGTHTGRVGAGSVPRRSLGLSQKHKSLTAATQHSSQRADKALKHAAMRCLRAGYLLTYCGHDPMELVNTAIESFRRVEWSGHQVTALEDWFGWVDRWEGPTSGEQPIQELLPILSRIFFLGKLHEVKFEFEENMSSNAIGSTTSWRSRHGVVYVRVDPADWSASKGVKTHRDAILSTVLHECVHSFITLYGCRDGCESCVTASGRTGHGRAWFHLASNVQAVARSAMQVDARLSVFKSMQHSHAEPDYIPISSDWALVLEKHAFVDLLSWFSDPEWQKSKERGLLELISLSKQHDSNVYKVLHDAHAAFKSVLKECKNARRPVPNEMTATMIGLMTQRESRLTQDQMPKATWRSSMSACIMQ